MKRWTRMLLMLVLVILGATAVVYWQYSQEAVETVTTVEVSHGTIEQTVAATGSVEVRRKVLVTAEPGSRISTLYFNEQDIVAKGQILAKLDDIELFTQLRQMEATQSLAKSNLQNAEALLEQSKILFEKGYIARQEVEAAQQQVDVYRAQIEEKKAATQLLKAKIERSYIRAPISGAVTRKLVEVGGIVSDGSRGFSGGSGGQLQPIGIAEIAALEGLEFHVDVDQTEIGMIKRGQRAVITLDAFPDQQFMGTVEEVTLSSVEEMGGRVRYKVRVELQRSDASLRLGMTGTIEFIVSRQEHVLTLPTSALMQRGGEEYVFVVEEGRAHLRSVRTGLHNEDIFEVVAGIEAGEAVIDRGRSRVKDGQAVEVLNGRP
jgi:RND family efflux transporter MFP subunit